MATSRRRRRTRPDVHPLLRTRWSPRIWDSTHVMTPNQLALLIEAARWAPSAGNSQPWSFIVGRRGDEIHQRLLRHLAPSSAAWAPDSSLLVVNLCHRFVEDTDWEYSEFSRYDLGQAVAHMTFQALSMGLAARQFRAFDKEGLTLDFAVPAHWEVASMTAFGAVPGDGPHRQLMRNGGIARRDRREPGDLLRAAGNPLNLPSE